jgi:RHS repeat-associated protein
MDKLTYQYENIANTYDRNTNKLRSVDDLVPDGNYNEDIDDQDPDNYEYDQIGNLKKDVQEQIDNIEWNVSGKITQVLRIAGSAKPDLEFVYDAMGNRVAKIVKPAATKTDASTWTTTYYVRDATGNVMATYEKKKQTQVNIVWKEQMLYGSSRIGLVSQDINISSGTVLSTSLFTSRLGIKTFEGVNHLGNMLTSFSDRKIPLVSGTTVTSFKADVLTSSDYYAFGSSMPNRGYKGPGYRYGYNGKEKDDEMQDGGNNYDYGMRVFDARLGRFLSVDPLSPDYPELTPYQFASNSPIAGIDIDGLEFGWANDLWEASKSGYNTVVKTTTATYNQAVVNTTAAYNSAVKTTTAAYNSTVSKVKTAYNDVKKVYDNTKLTASIDAKITIGAQAGLDVKVPGISRTGVYVNGVSATLVGYNAVEQKGGPMLDQVNYIGKDEKIEMTQAISGGYMIAGGSLEQSFNIATSDPEWTTDEKTKATFGMGPPLLNIVQAEVENTRGNTDYFMGGNMGLNAALILGVNIDINFGLSTKDASKDENLKPTETTSGL